MTAKNVLRWTLLHRWTSLFCTLNLTLLCVTGLYLIFHHEIDDALGVVPKVEGLEKPRLPLEAVIESARQAKPGWTPMTYSEDTEHPGLVFVSMCPPGIPDFAEAKPLIFNAHTGALTETNLEETLSMWVLKLHMDLFLGFPGQLYIAFVGITFFIALISGTVLYAPFMRNLWFGKIRKNRGERIRKLDLHNLIGISTLAWCSIVTLSGVVLELAKPILTVYQMSDLAAMTEPYRNKPVPTRLIPLHDAVAAAEKAWPSHQVQFALFPGTPYSGEHHYTFFMATGDGLSGRILKLALIDAENGAVTAARQSPWYIKMLFLSGPLHFGDYAGMPLKILWALFTGVTLVLCITGLGLTLARIRRKTPLTPA